MGQILRNWRLLAAGIFSAALILGAYALAVGSATPQVAEASTETALLQQIATKDSSGDGLPDWEKALYGIPINATTTDYFGLGMTDGEAVAKGLIVPKAVADVPVATSTPTGSSASILAAAGIENSPASGSLTDSFAQDFFTLYISAEQGADGSLSDDQINALADQALTELENSVAPAPDFKTANDITVAGSGPDAMRAYAANAEAVFVAHTVQLPESELSYLTDYLNGDATALPKIQQIAASYRAIATGLAVLAVPEDAAVGHLALVNALARVGEADTDFGNVASDPLSSMLALQQYPQDVLNLSSALSGVTKEFTAEGIVLPAGSPGSTFVNLGSIVTTP